jgi:hypothetical protein
MMSEHCLRTTDAETGEPVLVYGHSGTISIDSAPVCVEDAPDGVVLTTPAHRVLIDRELWLWLRGLPHLPERVAKPLSLPAD